MATYYVRTDGNDANTGLGSATNLAWKTFQKALGATGATGGDIVYIAPGHYNEAVTIGGTYTSELQIVGDPTSSQFSGISSGYVKISQFAQPYNLARNNSRLFTGAQNLLHFKNIYCDASADGVTSVINITGSNIKFTNCAFINNAKSTAAFAFDFSIGINAVCTRCVFFGFYSHSFGSGSTQKDNLYLCSFAQALYLNATGHIVSNCTFIGNGVGVFVPNTGSGAAIYNSLFISNGTGFQNGGVSVYANNRLIGNTVNLNNQWTLTDGGGNVLNGTVGIDLGYASINNITSGMFFGSLQDSQNIGTGNTIASLPTDIYGTTWYGVNPDIGAITYRSTFTAGQYNPTERNAYTITIAPGETSRSLYLYLGATGVTHTTTNLTASYTRNGQASVPITLVAQTPTGSYVSGGFCEVSAPYARGTYRLDVPNSAFDFGADDVTIFVGGTNTTNGAVVTCNMQGIAGNIVHIGPFKVIADGLGSNQPLDIVQGVQAPVSVQLVDANENGVDISGATVEAKVYNAIGSLIATYSCVPVYAADGRCTFQLTTLVTNTAGVYNVTLTRTIGGNIVVFGPMKMIVRAN